MKIALFTIAIGENRFYINSAIRYFPYNKENFGKHHNVDYFLLTDRDEETPPDLTIVPCKTFVWPYAPLLKNNVISDYLTKSGKWDEYDYIYFIDADFAIGDKYEFLSDFFLIEPHWNSKFAGGFYGGKTQYFKKLCDLFYDEIEFIYTHKLPVPINLDEFYLLLFYHQYDISFKIFKMDVNINTLIFFDHENLERKIKEIGKRIFIHPYKEEGRVNKSMLIDSDGKEKEFTICLDESYIFNNFSYELGRLLPIDTENYRILWNHAPRKRDVLNIRTRQIYFKLTEDTI